jgi:hypothetical protein
MAYDEGMKQHANMARAKGFMPSGDHGCQSLDSVNGGHKSPNAGISHTPLGDHERAGPPHISRGGGKLPATAHSDHGPHHIPG